MAIAQVGLYASLTYLTLILLWRLIRRPKIRYPPSPTSIPLIGNLFSIPAGHDHIAFSKLGEQLGSDIIFLEILGQKIIVLNSLEVALEVLEKRSAFYSDRPRIPMIQEPELMNWSGHVSLLGYNDLWRHYRRIMNNWLSVRAVSQFSNLQEQQARSLLRRLLNFVDNTQPFEHIKAEFFFSMGSSMLQLAYGYKPQDPQDHFFKNANLAFHNAISAGTQTNFLVNLFPALLHIPDWFPGTSWKHTAREYGAQQEKAKAEPYNWVKAQMADGTHQPSILSDLLQHQKLLMGLNSGEREERAKEVGIVLFGGGTDTSATFLVNLVFALVLNPNAQARAQQELDAVLGQCVLPRISDNDRLPYIRNMIYEVIRLYPVLPLGLPHACFQDDVFRGYTIQKGTTILGNNWAISRDPRLYKDPEIFNPDRYLDPDVPLPPVFGWGRRKCPGLHFAESSTFIMAASLIAMFTFSKKRNTNGQEVIPQIELERKALIFELKPFEFEFKPRSEEHRQLILVAATDED
ncbi:unnamed protein product [Rhizoctonia solani]|uniref:O-methylsterigmatocystin oxidoreductase n=1 Tax=Rhizoctonia solani TaxID=456999 RepID=A0A8H2XTA5_9AGAM|nr:unnamed protein product [Rhizoctonia solani]